MKHLMLPAAGSGASWVKAFWYIYIEPRKRV